MSGRQTPGAVVDVALAVGPRLLSLDQAAGRLGLSRWQVREFVVRGHLPHVALPCPRAGDGRRTRRVLIDIEDVDRFIATWKTCEFEP